MKSLQECMLEYKIQHKKGDIKEAYKGLMEYIMSLRTYFKNKYPGYFISGNVYLGYMDMTYFSFIPENLKNRKLKIAIVFNHDTFRFEVWLGGYNKQVQLKYWKLFKDNGWDKYHIVPSVNNADSILEYVLADNPDFSDLDDLTKKIETGTLKFISDIENYLSK